MLPASTSTTIHFHARPPTTGTGNYRVLPAHTLNHAPWLQNESIELRESTHGETEQLPPSHTARRLSTAAVRAHWDRAMPPIDIAPCHTLILSC